MNKKLKRFISVLLAVVFVFASFISVYAANQEIKIYINGSLIPEFAGPPPMIVNNRLYLPFRGIGVALGGTAEWNGETRVATIYNKDTLLSLAIGSDFVVKIDRENKKETHLELKDAVPFVQDGYTMLPVRAFAEGFGADIKWEPKTKSVYITMSEDEAPVISDITINPAKSNRGDSVTLTVKTNASTNYVWVNYNAFRNPMESHALFASNNSGVKTWTVTIDPDGYFCVYANSINGKLDAAFKEMDYDEDTMSYKDYQLDVPQIEDYMDLSDIDW